MLGGRNLEHIYLCRNIILCWLISLDQVERTAGEALKLEANPCVLRYTFRPEVTSYVIIIYLITDCIT